MPEVQVANHMIAAGKEEEVTALLPRPGEVARTEPGGASFDAYRKVDDPEETS